MWRRKFRSISPVYFFQSSEANEAAYESNIDVQLNPDSGSMNCAAALYCPSGMGRPHFTSSSGCASFHQTGAYRCTRGRMYASGTSSSSLAKYLSNCDQSYLPGPVQPTSGPISGCRKRMPDRKSVV